MLQHNWTSNIRAVTIVELKHNWTSDFNRNQISTILFSMH
uniref:Uncharacterized protein n=1 Tax=Arundo donax TaxID=35708 RepID=A0A0A9AR79_ARUDO